MSKIPSQGGFDTPTVHVQNWTRAWLLQFYASQPSVRDPQTREVPRVKDFAQRVLWHKLTVHERVYKRSGTDKCPICSQKESVKHAMVECSMFKAAAAVIQHDYGPVATGVVAEYRPRLGNVVGKKCPLAVSMRSQGRSVTSVHIIFDKLAPGAV